MKFPSGHQKLCNADIYDTAQIFRINVGIHNTTNEDLCIVWYLFSITIS